MLLFNGKLAHMMGDDYARWSIIALSPALLVVCMTSAYRGYCQGRGNMIPTAYGQVVEELGKLIIGLGIRIFGITPFGWRFMGTLFGVRIIPEGYPALLVILPVGGFLTLGCLIAFSQWLMDRIEAKERAKEAVE